MKSLSSILILLLVVTAHAAEIHVRPDGPIRKPADAQTETRKNKGIAVVVHAGTYYLALALVFTAAYTGTRYVALGHVECCRHRNQDVNLAKETVFRILACLAIYR